MTLALAIVLLVVVQRLAELVWAQRNTARLKADGGVETGAGHYPLFVVLHAAWLGWLAWAAVQGPAVVWGWVVLFLALQAGRVWVLAALGRYWTTRIVTVPGAPLVANGPYRFMRHPNYLIAWAEIVVLPLAFGLWAEAAIFGVLKAALLAWRIRVEDAALAGRR